ncbi:MAG: histidinol-phosphatase [Chitinispirillaceae bacterium]
MFIIPDYHVHTSYCGHAEGSITQYVESAILKGIKSIGFSDHLGRYYLNRNQRRKNWSWGMKDEDVERYFEEISSVREIYKNQINISIGLEIDYIEGAEEKAEKILRSLPFDFTLASIHCLPRFGWRHIGQITEIHPALIYTEYFKAARSALKCGLFQSLAHLDFIWRYIPIPEKKKVNIFSEIEETVNESVKSSTALEINSNAYSWSKIHRPQKDPFDFFLDRISECKKEITVGSDAHSPVDVGNHFNEIGELLESKGINAIVQFERFEAAPVGLEVSNTVQIPRI